MYLLDQVKKLRSNLMHVILPSTPDGKVEDVLSGTSFEARQGIGLRIEPILSITSGHGLAFSMPGLDGLIAFKVKVRENERCFEGLVLPHHRETILANFRQQIEKTGVIESLNLHTQKFD